MVSDIPKSCGVETVQRHDVEDNSLKKRSLKRALDESDFLDISNKKSKVGVNRNRKTEEKSFSVIKQLVDKQLQQLEKSFAECHRKVQLKEHRLKLLRRDISKCSKELVNKKLQLKRVRVTNRIFSKRKSVLNKLYKKMLAKIEECRAELVVKEAQLGLMEDLIGERMQSLKTKDMELHRIMLKETELMDKFDKERERKEEEFEGRVKKHKSKVKELMSKEEKLEEKVKKLQSMEEVFEEQKKKLKSVKMTLDHQFEELDLRDKQLDVKWKELESKKEEFEDQVKDFESKKEDFEHQVKEFETRVKELESKRSNLKGR